MDSAEEKTLDFYRDPFDTYGYEMASEMAARGDAQAQQSVAVHLLVGKGVRKDVEKAQHWFVKAAENGMRFSQHLAGVHLVLGIGTGKS